MIKDIEERLSKITNDGNWFVMHGEDLMGSCGYDEPDALGWVKGGLTSAGQNAEFVANAPADIEYLLSLVRKFQEGLHQVKYEYDQGLGTDIQVCRSMYRAAQEALKEE